jgi:hypothetical protein
MAQSRELPDRIERLVQRTQDELLEASRQFADGLTKETGKLVPPLSKDIERVVDHAFTFAERVLKGQRNMVTDLVKTLGEESRRAAQAGQQAAGRIAKRAPAKRTAAKKAPAKRTAVKKAPAKRTAVKKAAVKRSPVKKAAVKKAAAKRASARSAANA